ncbi:MAG: NADH-quinone oxidoreductase subunit A [Phycisphaerales bacterium]|nr:NADH-quinone oxidoreductase subunit A [Hyphomonadaceae bacterium]
MGLDLLDYLPIIFFFAVATVLGAGFLIAAWVIAPKSPDKEKVSAYECGFNAFDDARMKFDVRFYLVAILFIIFDLEVAFLFPWAITLGAMPAEAGQFAFWSMMAFLGVLTVGFIYEWKKGALEWE